ncbi:hypothetical protein AVEN_218859-1 [Araneus ventricosus]|uniref:Uncharacterized protein n=1 Tax=Araneus ventricosus TaxID=182803 RepID=A0A4Y2NSS2_ARAVE|nr:hypothetical protein AVEN_218859-1 [Araneus ventricosus]
MTSLSWFLLLMVTFLQLNLARPRNSLESFPLYKRPIDDATIDRSVLPYASSYERPSMMKNYLAFLSRLSKKDLSSEDHPSLETHSPKRDNRKFQTQGWR